MRVRNKQKDHPSYVSRPYPMRYDWAQVAEVGPHTVTKQDFFKMSLLCEAKNSRKCADNVPTMLKMDKGMSGQQKSGIVCPKLMKCRRERCLQSFKKKLSFWPMWRWPHRAWVSQHRSTLDASFSSAFHAFRATSTCFPINLTSLIHLSRHRHIIGTFSASFGLWRHETLEKCQEIVFCHRYFFSSIV